MAEALAVDQVERMGEGVLVVGQMEGSVVVARQFVLQR